MMSAIRAHNDSLAILRVDASVIDLRDVIVSDRNAASDDVIFRPAEPGINALVEEEVYAEWWNHSRDARQKRCAEVLVPNRVPPEYIIGAYVRNMDCAVTLTGICPHGFTIDVEPHRYF